MIVHALETCPCTKSTFLLKLLDVLTREQFFYNNISSVRKNEYHNFMRIYTCQSNCNKRA